MKLVIYQQNSDLEQILNDKIVNGILKFVFFYCFNESSLILLLYFFTKLYFTFYSFIIEINSKSNL